MADGDSVGAWRQVYHITARAPLGVRANVRAKGRQTPNANDSQLQGPGGKLTE